MKPWKTSMHVSLWEKCICSTLLHLQMSAGFRLNSHSPSWANSIILIHINFDNILMRKIKEKQCLKITQIFNYHSEFEDVMRINYVSSILNVTFGKKLYLEQCFGFSKHLNKVKFLVR